MKFRMTSIICTALLFFALCLSACDRNNNVCPPVEGTPQPKPGLEDLIVLPTPTPQLEPLQVEIGGKIVSVDRLVEGPLCNDTWSGIVYVGCSAIVGQSKMDAEENPLFLQGCKLNIEPHTIVYVAAHNDAAYYKGCSCHTGEDPIP
jgi:hypothetical protein